MKKQQEFCSVMMRSYPPNEVRPVSALGEEFLGVAQDLGFALQTDGFISNEGYLRIRKELLKKQLEQEVGELTQLQEEVLQKISLQQTVAADVDEDFEENLSLGERLSDLIATFGGSWRFIFSFFGVMMLWIAANTWLWVTKPFDPFPFILLNLLLSCIAAIQAPIIMMSQNRQEARDRLRSRNDYQVNLKAELEIRLLHEKLDFILNHHGQHLNRLEGLMLELLEETDGKRNRKSGSKSDAAEEK
jgi:uncharacterized membrane protein